MTSLVVVTFDAPDEAAAVLESLRGQIQYGNISFDDTAVVSKDLAGKLHVKNKVSQGTLRATGALLGRFRNLGIDGTFVQQVSASLPPGTSALFMLIYDFDPEVVRVVLQEHHGHVLHTTLSPEAEATLKRSLY